MGPTAPEDDLPPSGTAGDREVRETAQERFDRIRGTMGLFLGPALAVLLALLPLPLEPRAHRLAAVLAGVVVFWITEAIPIPVTALLGPAVCVIAAVAPAKEVFAPFANPVIFLFIGSFVIAQAMVRHGLDRRIALAILSRRFIAGSPARVMVALGVVAVVLSMWMSNTATTAMLTPIAIGILGALGAGSREGGPSPRFAAGLLLLVAYACSVGGIGTPVGSPPNLIALGMIAEQTGIRISFLGWMKFAVPLVAMMLCALFGLIFLLHPPSRLDTGALRAHLVAERRSIGPLTAGGKLTAFAFLAAVVLWVAPGVAGICGAKDAAIWLSDHLPESVVAILAASLLFLVPLSWRERRFALTWREAARIDWGTILLFGGGLSLGEMMFRTGLAETLGQGLVNLLALKSLWGLTAVAIGLGIVVSELTSNTASANMVIPVMIAMAAALGVNPLPPALGACLGSSYGFMLPISTPPNAIVYGTGLVPITRMLRAGVLFDLLGFVVIWTGLRVVLPLLGMAG
jgi:sodium-dependent dicarboxylate transporter 2/3/5